MGLVIRQVGEKSLINVEDPSVLPVAGDLQRPRKRQRVPGDDHRVGPVPVAVHVVLHVTPASGRNLLPVSGVVRLDGESPAIAVQNVVVGDSITRRQDLDDALGKSVGDLAEEEEDREDESTGAGGHRRKTREEGLWRMRFLVFSMGIEKTKWRRNKRVLGGGASGLLYGTDFKS